MNLIILTILTVLGQNLSQATSAFFPEFQLTGITTDSSNTILEPWTYQDDFEDRDLGAWASYPLWQDIAYNQNFRVNEIIPGDPNISIVQKVTPYSAVDNYAGAQKLLDMYLVPGATIKFRYYLKTNQNCDWFKVRFAAGAFGKLDVTLKDVKINQWQSINIAYEDFIKENPKITSNQVIRVYALAFLTKFPNADPDMPIYLGLDDISFTSARAAAFKFLEPKMHKLPEFNPYIPQQHYYRGNTFELSGKWVSEAEQVKLEIRSFSNKNDLLYQDDLDQENDVWRLNPMTLDFPEGLYLARLSAHNQQQKISETTFTIHIAPRNITGKHPRLLFDEDGKKDLDKRFSEERFSQVYHDISENAKILRTKIPVESLHFDLDQFPDEVWLPTWDAWGSRIYHTGAALRLNARAYAFHQDPEAGEYVKQVLLRLATWPNWTHPWQTKRGRFSEHRTGSWSHRVAEAYDLVFDLMSPEEQTLVRKAIFKNIVEGVHRTYIYNDNITAATSNWLAMTVGGSLMCLSAIFDDGSDTRNLEPYFTGAILKLDRFINKVTDSKDGGWGEGYGYNNYSLSNLSYSLPSLENVFNIDLSQPLIGTYNEYIWGGLIKNKRWFEYGDSRGNLTSATNWAYLLSKYKEPRLSWFYHFLKENRSNYVANNPPASGVLPTTQSSKNAVYEDVIFNTSDIPQQDPFGESPVKLFRELGTTVFKSGWDSDDFVFVMRTGPAYNHQHLDQGSIWIADRGKIFVQERPLSNSHYYDDPIYESWLTQPVGHSTILINGNKQSQRVGDHLSFAPGFDDYAFVSHFLDGEAAAFSSGDIGRLYWGEVNELSRNVLYLKPRTLLLLDVTVPAKNDAAISLLFQTKRLADIQAKEKVSSIVKEDATMHVFHLAPTDSKAEAVETPHYLKSLQNTRPLEREGMLTVEAHTEGKPLIMASLITTAKSGEEPQVLTKAEDGFISGMASEQEFTFSTDIGNIYTTDNFSTDALTVTWNNQQTFVAKATVYHDQTFGLTSEQPVTFQLSHSGKSLKYYVENQGTLIFNMNKKPSSVYLNTKPTLEFSFDAEAKTLELLVPAGEGTISFE